MSDSGPNGSGGGPDDNVLDAADVQLAWSHEADPPALADYDPLPEEQPDERIPAAGPEEDPSPS